MASLATIPHYVFLGVDALSTGVIALTRYSKNSEQHTAVQTATKTPLHRPFDPLNVHKRPEVGG